MNEVDSCCLPGARKRKGSKRKIGATTGIARATKGTKYKQRDVLSKLSTEKRPPSK